MNYINSQAKKKILAGILILWLLLLRVFFVVGEAQAGTVYYGSVLSTIKITVCGDDYIDTDEQCDTGNLGGATCVSLGYLGGTLSCMASCDFNLTGCNNDSLAPPPGGGGGALPPPVTTTVIFMGLAYPSSDVSLLKDGQLAASVKAGADAKFEMSITGLSAGNYIFSLYSEDYQGNRSSLLTFPVSVTAGAITKVSGIFIAPTIGVNKLQIAKGDNLAILGQTTPESEVVISVNSAEELFYKTRSNALGAYLYNLDTAFLELGQHYTRSKSSYKEQISSYSKTIGFQVKKPGEVIEEEQPSKCSRADFNNDCRVNLIDFSIAAYWYKRAQPLAKVDLNGDGKVDLVDFSILVYNWTG